MLSIVTGIFKPFQAQIFTKNHPSVYIFKPLQWLSCDVKASFFALMLQHTEHIQGIKTR
jgi:hypothetical protein